MTVSFNEALVVVGKQWKAIAPIAAAFLAVAFWVYSVDSGVRAGEAKNKEQDTILERIEKLSEKLDTRMDGIDMNLGLILQLYGIDSSKVNRWRRIPGEPRRDTLTGGPVLGERWIKLSEDHSVGTLFYAEWDEDKKKIVIIETVLYDLRKI